MRRTAYSLVRAIFAAAVLLGLICDTNIVFAQTLSDLNNQSGEFEDLLMESDKLMNSDKPLEARSKLEQAMKLKPDDFRPYAFLAEYYLSRVGHFTLAYKYILRAEEVFTKHFGNPPADITLRRMFAMIVELRAEAELNLDKYSESLKTLDRVPLDAASTGYPSSRAWVLMKLKRISEAIAVAQAGLQVNADLERTFNVLGILLSMNGNRELSLQAFANAMRPSLIDGLLGNIATPLNNSGEVYREMFNERMAEAAWLRATSMRDGCEHILPSLNLSILYTDEIRLDAAEKALRDFEICFAKKGSREDTEHRALLALGRGKIELRRGNADRAIDLLEQALEQEQWFGKIGTNENDLRFAASISLSQALLAKANSLDDVSHNSFSSYLEDALRKRTYKLRAWWLMRKARNQGRTELDDFEDLSLRNTDTMVEYPTLGALFADYPTASLEARVKRLEAEDTRVEAKLYYQNYLAENLMAHGEYPQAIKILEQIFTHLRPVDKLLRAQVITNLLLSYSNNRYFWQTGSSEQLTKERQLKEELFELLPSNLRYFSIKLPVIVDSNLDSLNSYIKKRFEFDESKTARYKLSIKLSNDVGKEEGIKLMLTDSKTGQLIAREQGAAHSSGAEETTLVNKFISACFSHKQDPRAEPVPKLDLLEGIL